jgi:peptidoglycan/xylan/chitin deacetylase (PgdA/CDA1 family)
LCCWRGHCRGKLPKSPWHVRCSPPATVSSFISGPTGGRERRGVRTKLAGLLDFVGLVDAALYARQVIPLSFLPVVTYHRIRESSSHDGFDEGVVDATPTSFERQVKMLARSFKLIDSFELASHVHARRPLPPNAAMITFDDGYRECHDIVLPILLRQRAKATFFVASSFVAERRIFWWDAVEYLVGRSQRTEVLLDYPVENSVDLGSPALRRDAVARFTRILKDHHGLSVSRFLDELARALDVAWSPTIERALAEKLIMTWDQVRALKAAGMDVQSHTRTHRPLHTVPNSELDSELSGSRDDIEAALDGPVRAIAYPVGRGIRQSAVTCSAVERAGYRLGFSNGSGSNPLNAGIDPLDVRRLSVESSMPESYFRATVMFPALAHPRASRLVAPTR